MDTFKMQDNEDIPNLCGDNNCAVVIVPHNLANKFQLLDITVTKPAKCFISEKHNKWFTEQVANHLSEGKNLADVECT